MEISLDWFTAWLIAASLLAVLLTVWDKSRARRRAWRVSESTLWLVAALGGAAVMCLTMAMVGHKTLHRRFMVGLPLLLAAQIAVGWLLWHAGYLIFI